MGATSDAVSVAVVGGSIAGCAAAIAARRTGCDVTVYERSGGDLAERGFGIALSSEVHDELTTAGYLSPTTPAVPVQQRIWMTCDPGGDGDRVIWRQTLPAPLKAYNWGLLWRSLRASLPDTTYRPASRVTRVRPAGDGRAVVNVDGPGEDAPAEVDVDLVIGADGYRSIVRHAIAPGREPQYAGYVLWRGYLPLADLSDEPRVTELLSDAALTVMYDRGHAVVYLIPDGAGGLRINWALYAHPPRDLQVDSQRGSFAPGTMVDDLVAWGRTLAHEHLPAPLAQVVTRTPDQATALQPIWDMALESSARMPFLVLGDANAITRPHTGSGAVKALQDALCLEKVLRASSSVTEAVEAYDAERRPAANQLVELGRRIGRDQVETTPDWSTMDADTLSRYVAATFAGRDHHLFSEDS